MKKYNTPELRMSMFVTESVETTNDPLSYEKTSFEAEMAAAGNAGKTARTITVDQIKWTF